VQRRDNRGKTAPYVRLALRQCATVFGRHGRVRVVLYAETLGDRLSIKCGSHEKESMTNV